MIFLFQKSEDGHYMKNVRIQSYSGLHLLAFALSRIRTEYGEILRISPYSVQMRENTDQNNSEYGQFLRSGYLSNHFKKSFFKIFG